MQIKVFFSYGVSLKEWDKIGIISREIAPYLKLAERGHDIALITYGDRSDLQFAKKYPSLRIIPMYSCCIPKSSVLKLLSSFYFIIRNREIFGPQTIVKSNQMMGAWLPTFASMYTGSQLLIRVGYELYEFFLNREHRYIKRSIIKWVSSVIYNNAQRIMVTTGKTSLFIQSHFGNLKEVIRVHANYIDTELFDYSDDKEDELLYVGRLDEHKNLKPVIEACAVIKKKLILVGEGALKSDLKSYGKSIGAEIEFKGLVPNSELPFYYKRARYFILNSFSEGNPKVLLEAMSCGCICIGNNVTGIKDILDGHNGVLTNGTSKEISNCIRRIDNEAGEQYKFRNKARSYVLNNCSLDSFIDFEERIYEELINE
jgi:glycosyltransferase involved in cell wall biosynthesis